MNNRIIKKMEDLKTKGGKSFATVLMIGDPDITTTDKLIKLAYDCQVDIIELGIPDSNPFLDSPGMKASMQRALAFSDNLDDYLNYLKYIRNQYPEQPFEVMIYHNTVMQIGLEKFAKSLQDAQMDAVLVADYVLHGDSFLQDLDKNLSKTGVIPIRFVPHPFNLTQVNDIKENGRGFVISQTITDNSGERRAVLDKNKEKIDFLRSHGVKTPIVLAYGIKSLQDITKCIELGADGVLLGTVILDAAHKMPLEDFRKYLSTFRSATQS